MTIAEIKMLKWISRMIRVDTIKNKYVKGSNGVASIVDKRKKNK
jgi:hypothetical protein